MVATEGVHLPKAGAQRPDKQLVGRSRVMADDLDDFDRAEGGPQPAEGRKLVIVDLGHATIMPPPWPEHDADRERFRGPGWIGPSIGGGGDGGGGS